MTAEAQLDEDRQLFQRVEDGAADYGWRLWENPAPTVVLGRFGRAAEEVFEAHCARDGVPVVRRISGGGAVVISAGCLNFSAVFSLEAFPELLNVARSFELILGGLASALAMEGLSVGGGTDLVVAGRKVSGNAQRRGRRALIHHGTLLYDFDRALATRYLREPRRQPHYRMRRTHDDFIGSLGVPRDLLATRLSAALAGGGRFWHR